LFSVSPSHSPTRILGAVGGDGERHDDTAGGKTIPSIVRPPRRARKLSDFSRVERVASRDQFGFPA
jgi:hypothetical protein